MTIPGGYHPLTVTQLGNILHALVARQLTWAGARVWFACAELAAIRQAARRSRRPTRRKREGHFDFDRTEIAAMTVLAPRVVARALARLEKLALLRFSSLKIEVPGEALADAAATIQELAGSRSPNRPVPVPRRLLRYLAQLPTASIGRVLIGYVCRGLTLERRTGGIRHRGTVKASWLAETLGLSLRAVRYARDSLRTSGWIGKDLSSRQWKLNRDGSWFEINLEWSPPTGIRVPTEAPPAAPSGEVGAQPGTGLAPRTHRNGTQIAPPREDKRTPSEDKNQGTQSGVLKPGTNPQTGAALPPPTLSDIRLADLSQPDRLRALVPQAVARGWIRDCESDTLNFLAAAVRARSTPSRDPVRVFVWLIRSKRWAYVAQSHEDEARRMLRPARSTNPRVEVGVLTNPHPLGAVLGTVLARISGSASTTLRKIALPPKNLAQPRFPEGTRSGEIELRQRN